ncbi:hypothetical protein ACJX0J_016712, partial [Zea mays]
MSISQLSILDLELTTKKWSTHYPLIYVANANNFLYEMIIIIDAKMGGSTVGVSFSLKVNYQGNLANSIKYWTVLRSTPFFLFYLYVATCFLAIAWMLMLRGVLCVFFNNFMISPPLAALSILHSRIIGAISEAVHVFLEEAIQRTEQFPEYEVKVIGHSMGAGIATILTYILRENEKLSSSTCIAFGPAACMTWDLAESGKDFVTTIVNRNDLVPSLGIVSAAKLRIEVMSSSWAHDLGRQIQQTRFLGFVNRSVSFIRSHVPFVSDPRSKVVDVDMLQSQSPE